MKEKLKRLWPWYALAFFLVLADQEVKLWVRNAMELGEARPFLPHLIELYYVENTGGAFSLFNEHTWLLALLSAAVSAALVVALWKGRYLPTAVDRLWATLVLAGAAGNLIDRTVYGKVTDMFNFTFVRFGVFNVADICVVCGVIGWAAWLLLGPRDREDGHEADADSPQ